VEYLRHAREAWRREGCQSAAICRRSKLVAMDAQGSVTRITRCGLNPDENGRLVIPTRQDFLKAASFSAVLPSADVYAQAQILALLAGAD
jgi:hypothetical protein